MKIKILLIISLCILSSCKDDVYVETFSDPEYPTKYCLLTDGERDQLYTEFDYPLKKYFEIDSFGYLDRNWEQQRENDLFEGIINSEEQVLKIAKEFIDGYSKLTGVTDTSTLIVKRIQGTPRMEEDKNRWFVQFENQVFDGIEVYDTQIGIYISFKGVYETFGNWYPEIYIPASEDLSFEEAKEKLRGIKLGYSDWTGPKTHTISESDFYDNDSPLQMIVPYRNNDCIELRLCWMITSKTIWNFYVDVMSGQLIMNEQTVIF